VAAPVAADLVILPRFTGRTTPRCYPCPPAQAAFTLAAGVLNGHLGMARAVDLTGRIARLAACHTVESGEIGATADTIIRLAVGCSGQPRRPASSTPSLRTCVPRALP